MKLIKEHVTSKYNQMHYINLASCISVLCFTLITSGRFTHAIGFPLNSAPLWKHLVVSISIVCAGACQREAFKYVSSLVQMLGKSFAMMPVMVCGLTVSGMRYGTAE